MIRLGLIFVVACAAQRPAPMVITPAVPVVELQPRHCELPPIPKPAEIVGYPTPQTIYVTVTDLDALSAQMAATAAWIKAATRCLTPTVE